MYINFWLDKTKIEISSVRVAMSKPFMDSPKATEYLFVSMKNGYEHHFWLDEEGVMNSRSPNGDYGDPIFEEGLDLAYEHASKHFGLGG